MTADWSVKAKCPKGETGSCSMSPEPLGSVDVIEPMPRLKLKVFTLSLSLRGGRGCGFDFLFLFFLRITSEFEFYSRQPRCQDQLKPAENKSSVGRWQLEQRHTLCSPVGPQMKQPDNRQFSLFVHPAGQPNIMADRPPNPGCRG